VIKPYISAYLLIMGVIILVKAFRKPTPSDGTHGAHFSLLAWWAAFSMQSAAAVPQHLSLIGVIHHQECRRV
jgi:hypothetical protein